MTASTHPKEVLVVEDEAIIRMVAADALADRGIMAWEAGDAHEALKMLEQHPRIGLLFTDINMPGDMNGLGLAHEVSVSRPALELIVTSGAVTLSDQDLPDHGTFLPKPYPTYKLVSIIEEKLDNIR
jgi:CheY-like chemotaxis protein